MSAALFPGVFDPCTNGHLWMVARSLALGLFDNVVVGVQNDPARETLFDPEERVRMWQESAEGINPLRIDVVHIGEESPVRSARRLGCRCLLRDIRTVSEYEDEVVLQRVNHDLEPTVKTVFLLPDDEYANVSGSVVRGLIGKPRWQEAVKQFIPVATWEALMHKCRRTAT
jgi:pantetheine-phosphate adenylyltransferase